VREGLRSTPFVDQRQEIFHLLGDVVEIRHLIVHADEAAFGTGTVVAGNVEDQCVVHFTNFLNRGYEAANLVVSLLQETAEYLCLTDEHTLFVGGQGIPVLNILGLRR